MMTKKQGKWLTKQEKDALDTWLSGVVERRLATDGWIWEREVETLVTEHLGTNPSFSPLSLCGRAAQRLRRQGYAGGCTFSVFKLFNPGTMSYVLNSVIWAVDEEHAMKGFFINLCNMTQYKEEEDDQ